MPVSYFHICDDKGSIPDTEGMFLPDLAAAMREGEDSARELVAADIRERRQIDHSRIEVMTEDGDVVAVYPFRALLH